MHKDSRRRLESIFHASRDRAVGAERNAYLDGACGSDADLRARVDALLAADVDAKDFLESPAVSGTNVGAGSTIGVYKLLQEIGEGGMGVVYMAEQQEPVRRKVALKVIKLGMDTKQVIARFEAERQALAMMDHEHIARVFGAGATEAGRPYFVMELVRGVPISTYCDTHKLSTAERLGLFVSVCRAVQHAHNKGVIHRDLKPTNVLVTSHDGVPVPKIIDFGVAKATNQKLTERTLFTEFHQLIGTPEYMSPEQAEMSGLDVDTRSDIYSLGVILYQLLTGSTPVDSKVLRTAGFEEMTRMIREDEPISPSSRITRLRADGQEIANHRNVDAGELSRNFRGDLDWMVMKALEKDRTRRYETAAAFAEDVVRHLEHKPVEAGPPGALYRVRKFVRRNRRAVVGGLVLLTVLGLGLAGTTLGFVRSRASARRSAEVGDTLQDVLAMTNPGRYAEQTELEDLLGTVREVFGDDHATYAAVLDTLSTRLHDAGEFQRAAELCVESLDVWKSVHGERHPNVANALARLGALRRALGDNSGAEEALRASLELSALEAGRSPLANSQASYDARVELAELLGNRGDYAEADGLIGESLAILRNGASPPHFRILQNLERRAILQMNQPGADARETIKEIYAETHQFYPDDSPMLAVAALGYGRQLFQHEQKDEAEPYLREALRRFEAMAEPPQFYLLMARDQMFQILRVRKDDASIAEADDLLRDLIDAARGIWDDGMTGMNLRFYSIRLMDRGRMVDALDALVDGFQVLAGDEHSIEEREPMRDMIGVLCVKVALSSGHSDAEYGRAREAIELALGDEPTHPAFILALGAVQLRQHEDAAAVETLGRVKKPLSRSRSSLARKMSPVDHAFRALLNARLGNDEIARKELAIVNEALGEVEGEDEARALAREIESLLDSDTRQ